MVDVVDTDALAKLEATDMNFTFLGELIDAALNNTTRDLLFKHGLVKSGNPKDKVSPAELVAIGQAVCVGVKVMDTSVCPFINGL